MIPLLCLTLEDFGALNNIAVIEDEINREITKISQWLHSSKLLLNTPNLSLWCSLNTPKSFLSLN